METDELNTDYLSLGVVSNLLHSDILMKKNHMGARD
jgi:hypothetical protein